MNIYRGIKVDDNVKLYNKDGSYNNKIKNSLDIFVDKLSENGHELLSEYVGAQDKVLINFKCGHNPHLISPAEYKTGRGCRKCGDIKCAESLIKKTKEEFVLLVKSNGHLLLSDYVGAKERVLIDFQCGHGAKKCIPDSYKHDIGCPECLRIRKAEKFLLLLSSNGHEMVEGEYLGSQTKVCIDFKCSHKPHWATPNSYKQGSRCPECNESKGERRIREYLVNFELFPQKEFEGLIGLGGRNLSYDFYLPNENTLIEYQGEQHDRYIQGIHGIMDNFKKQLEHDKRKREFAIKNNINLLEIWYWDYENIESILMNYFNIKQVV